MINVPFVPVMDTDCEPPGSGSSGMSPPPQVASNIDIVVVRATVNSKERISMTIVTLPRSSTSSN